MRLGKRTRNPGMLVRDAIKEAGMTQKEVAALAEMSHDHLHKIKTNAVKPSLKSLARIGRVVRKPLNYFFK